MHVNHISNIGIKPESVAFASYVISTLDGMGPYQSLMFKKCTVPFGKCTAKWVAAFEYKFGNSETVRQEYWITFKGDEPAAMISKKYINGETNRDEWGFYQFVMREYHKDCVMDAIKSLPPATEL